MKFASDIMTFKLKMIPSGDSLESVVRMFLQQGIKSSPVINPVGEVLGILSEVGLMKAFMLHKASLQKNDKVGHHVDLLEPIAVVKPDTPIIDVLKTMISSATNRVLVKDDQDRYVGIISPKDIMRAILGEPNPSVNLNDKIREAEFQIRQLMHKLKQTEARLGVYEQVFHETPYMMHAANEKGDLLMMNRRELDTLGYEPHEITGKTIFDIYAPAVHAEAKAGLKRIMESGFHHVTYTTIVKKDGSTLRCDIASAAIHDDAGNFVSTISVLRPFDGDELLRTLNGIVNDQSGPLARYAKK